MSITFGTNKASDRKALKDVLVAVGLTNFVATVVGTAEKKNADINHAVEQLGFVGFVDTLKDVLVTQTSRNRGRPALEEQPIHDVIGGLNNARAVYEATENMEKALKALNKSNVKRGAKVVAVGLQAAMKSEARLVARRALYNPSNRIQGTKLLPILPLPVNEEA